jgi:hypothetical protein
MKWNITELRRHAMNDQTQFEDRPWTYTSNCNMCGGVKAFLDWLEAESKEWYPSTEEKLKTEIIKDDKKDKLWTIIEEARRLGIK